MKTVMIDHPEHASDYFAANYRPLAWQIAGLQKTASGYGTKLPTRYTVKYQGKERRVYADCYSNVAATYIIVNGQKCLFAKEVLKMGNMQKVEFESSIDATEYLDKLQKMLYDPRLVNWCKATDQNFMANSYASLQQMQVKLTELKNKLDDAC